MPVKFKNNVKVVVQAMHNKIETRLALIGRMMGRYFDDVLTGPRDGRVYFEPKIGRIHQASSRIEYPAEMTGDLLKSMDAFVGNNSVGPFLSLGSDLEYALDLETRDVLTQGGRPFLSRAMHENLDDIMDALRKPYV